MVVGSGSRSHQKWSRVIVLKEEGSGGLGITTSWYR